ncbi:B3 domain-containing protein At5g25470-like [Lycium barbarum]|uniref:B3 domain-containing protein At5g25470-like n=1 Tax=Lycium barbarum TaxID=112863 RepID=UPI00293E0A17|nr:B3 domain-containing protein At5g25470-like [Lycium barbarum]
MLPAFIKENKNMLAKTCLLKSNIVGMSWEASIVRKKSNYFICEGEWSHFVVHHQLELGDILLFFLIDKSTFQVLVYNQKSYKNFSGRQLFEELSSSSQEKQDYGNTGPSRKSKRVNTEPEELSGTVAEEEEANSESEENGPKKIRFSVVNLNSKDPYYEMVIKKSHSIFMGDGGSNVLQVQKIFKPHSLQ